jgi:hypothetical protein
MRHEAPAATGGGQMTETEGQEPVPDDSPWADRLVDLVKTAMQCATVIGVVIVGHGGHL